MPKCTILDLKSTIARDIPCSGTLCIYICILYTPKFFDEKKKRNVIHFFSSKHPVVSYLFRLNGVCH